jgi:hypothetical protein
MTVIDMASRRQPVVYTIVVEHGWDGQVAVEVHDLANEPRSRKCASEALLAAAAMLDSSGGEAA